MINVLIQRFDEIASCLISIGALEAVRETVPVNELHYIDNAIQEHIDSLFNLINEVLDESEFTSRVIQQAKIEARGHRLMLCQRHSDGAS